MIKNNFCAFFFLFLILISSCLFAQKKTVDFVPKANASKYSLSSEKFFFIPVEEKGPRLQDIIFDQKISKELVENFQVHFGSSSFERPTSFINKYDEFTYKNGQTVNTKQDAEKKSVFGLYMGKRMVEYHFDRLMKSRKTTRRIYEIKDQFSRLNIDLKKGYKLTSQYFYSGNYFNVILQTPFELKQTLSFRMNPNAIGPTDLEDIHFNNLYEWDAQHQIQLDFKIIEKAVAFVYKENWTESFSYSLSVGAGWSEDLFHLDQNEKSQILFGLAYQY